MIWKLSAKWAAKEIDCTLHGIQAGCGGSCCKGFTYWPPKASGTGACANLGPNGCLLGNDKPVTCLLYPFRLRGNTLVINAHVLGAGFAVGKCVPCYRRGGKTIAENNRDNFAVLFGKAQAELIVRNTLAGIDTEIEVPQAILDALATEQEWEAANRTPPGRSALVANHT